MALKISDSRSFQLEPLRKNRWVFQFSSIPGSNGNEEELAFVAHTSNAPQLSFNDSSYKRMNETFKLAGTPIWNDINASFYDFIRKGSGKSAGDILYDWASVIYNPLTGQQGYKTQYATSGTLAQLDPAGNVIRAWNLFSIFPQSVDFGGSFSAEDDGLCEISVAFKYDLAIKITDSTSSTQSA